MIFCFGSKLKASTRSHFPRLFPRKSLCVLLREKRKEKKSLAGVQGWLRWNDVVCCLTLLWSNYAVLLLYNLPCLVPWKKISDYKISPQKKIIFKVFSCVFENVMKNIFFSFIDFLISQAHIIKKENFRQKKLWSGTDGGGHQWQ